MPLIAFALLLQTAQLPSREPQQVSVVEASIEELRGALASRRTTSRELVTQYLIRIAMYDGRLNAVLAVNPRALLIADSLDEERRAGHIKGPLHGIPLALKDNIQTLDMPTTGGLLAFDGFIAPYEATLVRNLKASGAIILAKTQMTELADAIAMGMPSNYSALGGFGMNPWDPRRDPRKTTGDGRPVLGPGGSSSGVGTNVSFWAATVGTETSGSILNPAQQNFLVGLKPTVGRLSRYGIIPFDTDVDTPGIIARTVTDAALLLGELQGVAPDSNDTTTTRCIAPPRNNYLAGLKRDGLKGVRIGVPRAYFETPLALNGRTLGGINLAQRALFDSAIRVLRQAGATIVDPSELPSVIDTAVQRNAISWSPCWLPKGQDSVCSTAMKYAFKRDFNSWLTSLGDHAPVRSLSELREWNREHERAGAIRYGQQKLDASDEINLETDRARYDADRRKDLLTAATNGIDAALIDNHIDALLFPGTTGRNIAARAGYPTVFVPFGFAPVDTTNFPAAFSPRPAPFGVSFTAGACTESRLLALAYAFEQATMARRPPPLFP